MSRVFPPLAVLLLLLCIWLAADLAFDPSPLVFPGPQDVYESFATGWSQLLYHTSVTMSEALLGFALATAFGYALAVAFILFKPVEAALYPFAIGLKAMPLVALAPILVVWLGQGLGSKVVMAALVAFFPILVSSVDGLNSMDRDLVRLFDGYRASKWQRLRLLQIPASIDSTFSGLKIASTLAVVGAVIAEFTGASAGVGFLIKLGAYNLDTPLMFASVFCIGIAGILLFALVSLLHSRAMYWRR